MPLHIQTPLVESRPLSLSAGRPVWLKLEALQPCGSFKLRGVGHACETHQARGAQHFVSSSGGNAGLAVAYAGRKLGLPVTVVVHGSSWQEANAHAQTLQGPDDAFIHPFDDPLLWTGHASMIDEVAAAGLKPDAVVLSVGGGGLLSGVVEGLQRNGWHDVPVLAVETEGAASLHEAIKAGHTVELPGIQSVATSLGAKRVAEQALACSLAHPVHSHLVSDREALQACERLLRDHRVLVEPACGAALALLQRPGVFQAYGNVLVIVCGGATATLEQIRAWLEQVA